MNIPQPPVGLGRFLCLARFSFLRLAKTGYQSADLLNQVAKTRWYIPEFDQINEGGQNKHKMKERCPGLQ